MLLKLSCLGCCKGNLQDSKKTLFEEIPPDKFCEKNVKAKT